MLNESAHYVATEPRSGISSVHSHSLGGLSKTAHWTYAASRGEFNLLPDQQGIEDCEI